MGRLSVKCRKIAFAAYPNKCFHCGSTKKFHVHHLDRDIENNNVANLRIVCPKCHFTVEHTHPMWGKHFSADTKQKMSLKKRGKPNPKESKTKKRLFAEGKLKMPEWWKTDRAAEIGQKISKHRKKYYVRKRKEERAEKIRKVNYIQTLRLQSQKRNAQM